MMHSHKVHSRFQQKQNRQEMFNSHTQSLNLKQSTSTGQCSQGRSQQNLHVLKLQSKALDMLKKIEHQKFQIYSLTEQAQNLMRICDEQKSYLRSVNVDMMKQQYEEQVYQLIQQQEKVLQIVKNLKEENHIYHKQKQQKINTARFQNQLLTQKIQNTLLEKQSLISLIHRNNTLKKEYQAKLSQQDERIDELRHVQRKVAISFKQLQALRNKHNQF